MRWWERREQQKSVRDKGKEKEAGKGSRRASGQLNQRTIALDAKKSLFPAPPFREIRFLGLFMLKLLVAPATVLHPLHAWADSRARE